MTISSRPKVRKITGKNPSILESLGVSISGGTSSGSQIRVKVSGLSDNRVSAKKRVERLDRPIDVQNRIMSDLGRSARQGNLLDVNLILEGNHELVNCQSNASEDSFGSSGSPLHYATIGNQPDVVYALLARGAIVSIQSSRGLTPLHLACLRGYVECASLLLDHGASMMSKDKFGLTPMAIVCSQQTLKELKPARTAIHTYYKRITRVAPHNSLV